MNAPLIRAHERRSLIAKKQVKPDLSNSYTCS